VNIHSLTYFLLFVSVHPQDLLHSYYSNPVDLYFSTCRCRPFCAFDLPRTLIRRIAMAATKESQITFDENDNTAVESINGSTAIKSADKSHEMANVSQTSAAFHQHFEQ
jgi:hypothetical protein